MTGRTRGRPAKTDDLAVQLLGLAAYARRHSQDGITERINEQIEPESVTQPTVGKWLRTAVPELIDPTIAIRRPESLGLRVVWLLFRREPARALQLVRLLAKEKNVSRVEQWRGEFNVAAEVVVADSKEIDRLVERFEPDALHEVAERIERLPDVLQHLGQQAVKARH